MDAFPAFTIITIWWLTSYLCYLHVSQYSRLGIILIINSQSELELPVNDTQPPPLQLHLCQEYMYRVEILALERVLTREATLFIVTKTVGKNKIIGFFVDETTKTHLSK